ncbi:MAG: hypothetical protein HN478_00690, partial [Rhodospirillaceae bacterium]|nr:hypothetical protein [Rhodospirillaceae bacterium]
MGSGADGQFLSDFRALAEATAMSGDGKYSPLVLQRLARFLAGHGGGRNRDTPLFELCHLVNAVDAACGDLAGRWRFFLGGDRITAAGCRRDLEDLLAASAWCRDGFAQTDDGVAIDYGEDEFLVTYGRMPVLVAIYEFLASMDDFAFHGQLGDIFEKMLEAGGGMRAIQDGANGLAAAMRHYRGRHLEQGMHDDAFMAILNYLRGQRDDQRLNFADEDILQFWCQHNAGDFRTYRRAYQRFAYFTEAMAVTQARRSGEVAAPLGSDWELGEVEPDDLNHAPGSLGELAAWSDPLPLLDSGPAAEIKFFTASGEREPLAPLAEYGPFARRLPLAFLRYVAFGSVQAAITTALQFRPGEAVEQNLLDCGGAESYQARRALYEKLHDRLDRLQKAAYYALSQAGPVDEAMDGDILAFPEPSADRMFEAARRQLDQGMEPSAEQLAALEAEAAKAFKQIARRGFEAEALDREDRREGFRVGAGVLTAVGEVLDGYLGGLERLDRDGGLAAQFT